MTVDFGLKDRVAIVTGASRGIGHSIALALAEQGADLIVVSRTPEALAEVVQEIEKQGRRAMAVSADIGHVSESEKVVKSAVEAFGHIDILVNNAAVSHVYKAAEKVTEDEWDTIVDINLKGTFFMCQAAGREMITRGTGKIVNISSIGGIVALERLVAYCASKAGVLQLTRVLAVEWARHNVQVNAIAPGWVATEFTRGLRENQALYDRIMRYSPSGQMATPEQIAGVIVFLASQAANHITGAVIPVDGGYSAL